MNHIIFILISIIHVIIWAFVILAFINKKTAYINIIYIIPFIYLIHILPFHILTESKKNIYPKTFEDEGMKINKIMIIPYYFIKVQTYLKKKCTESPISPQGILIFGAITSSYRLILT